jgi:hypothetical protein
VAAAVIREARESGVGSAIPDREIDARVRERMWEPVYPEVQPIGPVAPGTRIAAGEPTPG